MIREIHHVAIVVRSLEEACRFYRDSLGLGLHKEANLQDQGVKAAILTLGDCELELLEPISPEGGVARFLERRGEGLHHICFQTDDVREELAGLRRRGVEVIDEEPREGLAGLICFLHPQSHRGVLVELAQPPEQGRGGDPSAGSGERGTAHPKRFDHVVLAVRELDEAAKAWERSLGLKVERVFEPAGSNMRLARLPAGNAFLVLAQPLSPDHGLAAFMDERGEGMFALSVEVDGLGAAVTELRSRGVQVSDPEPVPWEGTRLARIDRESAHGVTLQLIERS